MQKNLKAEGTYCVSSSNVSCIHCVNVSFKLQRRRRQFEQRVARPCLYLPTEEERLCEPDTN